MLKNVLTILFALGTWCSSVSQEVIQVEAHPDQPVYLTGEEVWVDGLLSGTLYTPKTTQVQLLDRKGIARATVRLLNVDGHFSGFIQVPADLVSDFYFLDAYVQGQASIINMRPIMVINPRTPLAVCPSNAPDPVRANTALHPINISTDKNAYGKREKVLLTASGLPVGASASIVVQRYDILAAFADSISRNTTLVSRHEATGEQETEGNIIHARVLSTLEGTPQKGIRVFAAIVGDQAKVSSCIADEDGRVKFIFPFVYGETQVVFSLPGIGDNLYRIEMEEDSVNNLPINFPCLQLTERMRPAIEERILAYRVQKGYYGDPLKRYSLLAADTTDFYGKPDHYYALDDYVRFPGMADILLEFVPEARVRNGETATPVIQVLDEPYKTFFESQCLVMLDGVAIQDIKELLAFNTLLIKSVDVMSRKYYLGDTLFNGIVHYKTYKGDLAGFVLPARDVIYPYNGIQIPSVPVFPDYSINRVSPLPDLRNLLLLQANRATSKDGQIVLPFYTADADGQFRVLLTGTDKNGTRIYGEKFITIE